MRKRNNRSTGISHSRTASLRHETDVLAGIHRFPKYTRSFIRKIAAFNFNKYHFLQRLQRPRRLDKMAGCLRPLDNKHIEPPDNFSYIQGERFCRIFGNGRGNQI